MGIEISVWATIAIMHFVAVISPGPDFAIVLKQSLQRGLASALWTSLGIGTAILLHVAYSILGISIVIRTTPWLYTALLYTAAVYFIYIGISGLRSKPSTHSQNDTNKAASISTKWYKAFGLGFLTNGLNPKATLFFLALFTAAIPQETSLFVQVFYGVYLAIATTVWFCFLSYISSREKIRLAYQSHGYYFDRFMGVVLIGMAIFLVI